LETSSSYSPLKVEAAILPGCWKRGQKLSFTNNIWTLKVDSTCFGLKVCDQIKMLSIIQHNDDK